MISSGYCAECPRLQLAESVEVVVISGREKNDYLRKKRYLMVNVCQKKGKGRHSWKWICAYQVWAVIHWLEAAVSYGKMRL